MTNINEQYPAELKEYHGGGGGGGHGGGGGGHGGGGGGHGGGGGGHWGGGGGRGGGGYGGWGRGGRNWGWGDGGWGGSWGSTYYPLYYPDFTDYTVPVAIETPVNTQDSFGFCQCVSDPSDPTKFTSNINNCSVNMVPSCNSGQCICVNTLDPNIKGCNGVANKTC